MLGLYVMLSFHIMTHSDVNTAIHFLSLAKLDSEPQWSPLYTRQFEVDSQCISDHLNFDKGVPLIMVQEPLLWTSALVFHRKWDGSQGRIYSTPKILQTLT